MTRKQWIVWSLVAVVIVTALLINRKVLYSVSVANYGRFGVLLLHFPVKLNRPVEIEPGIPGVRDDIYIKGPFRDHPRSVPDKIEVEWQLADLKDCRRTFSSKSLIEGDLDSNRYVRQAGCTFSALPKRIFRKTVDLRGIVDSEVARRAGSSVVPWWPFDNSRYGLIIAFEFRDEELQVKARSFETNPWK